MNDLDPKVSVVILCYNNLQRCTKNCIESILKSKNEISYEVIVVDNNSTDGTKEWVTSIAESHPEIKPVFNQANLGFAKGNNEGIKKCTGKFVVLLNNDTLVSDFWLDKLCHHLNDPRVGLVGPLTNCIDSLQEVNILGMNTDNWVEIFEKFCQQNPPHVIEVKMICFFCVAMRTEIFQEIGLLDENYGIGNFEDDDFCCRVSNSKKILITTDCFVYHLGSASFNKFSNERLLKLYAENKAYFQAKNSVRYSYLEKLREALNYFFEVEHLTTNEIKSRERYLMRSLNNAIEDENYLAQHQVGKINKKQVIQLVDNVFLGGTLSKLYRKAKKWKQN